MASIFSSSLSSSSLSSPHSNCPTQISSSIFDSKLKIGGIELTHLKLWPSVKLKASRTRALMDSNWESELETENEPDMFGEMKQRFLSFKRQKFLENLEHFQNLAIAQAPKFMVIACADSRVCPSHVLGFQPGEAFIVRNVGNLVPPFEKGPSETNAALEFAVNTLEVENILVFGHSCCGGIRALMSMQDEVDSSSFIRSWVVVGNNARLSTKAAASKLSFDQQCRHCEKESVNRSLLNLLSYPWIKKRVNKKMLFVYGGYYDFVNCTFEKWSLDYKESTSKEQNGRTSVKGREFWC